VCGCFLGSVTMVPLLWVLLPDASALSPDRFPAPAAHAFATFTRLLSEGPAGLPVEAWSAFWIAAIAGVVLAGTEVLLPVKGRAWSPSATGLGLGFLLPASFAATLALGAVAAAILVRRARLPEERVTTLASGFLIGESLAAVAIGALQLARLPE
jgi:uncharacterized oligopeptide transporter (OPT) family protein